MQGPQLPILLNNQEYFIQSIGLPVAKKSEDKI